MQANPLPLKDLHLPDAISWFPPALGWWLLLILIPLLSAGLYWLYRRLTQKTALKTAKQLLANIENSNLSNQQKLIELSALLRRVAISTRTRQEAASLTGTAWLAFLDSSLNEAAFSTGVGRYLIETPYRNTTLSDQDLTQLIRLCEHWLTRQKS